MVREPESIVAAVFWLATATILIIWAMKWYRKKYPKAPPTTGATPPTKKPWFIVAHPWRTAVIAFLVWLAFVYALPIRMFLTGAVVAAKQGILEGYYGAPSGKNSGISIQRPHRRTENKNRYQFFVDQPRKMGWKVLPTEVDFEIPLDGVPRYLGMNIAFLGGSQLTIDCPGYWSGGRVKLFAKADEKNFVHLGHANPFSLTESGSVTGGGAILVKGEKDPNYEAISNRIHVEVAPLPGHHRIATTKICDAGTGYDWGTVQVGTREQSPPWQLYIRFADQNGITLTPSVMQQKPGEILFGVMENKELKEVFSEIVSKAANVYEPFNVPRHVTDPMLRIKTPNIAEGKVVVEVILDIDNTR